MRKYLTYFIVILVSFLLLACAPKAGQVPLQSPSEIPTVSTVPPPASTAPTKTTVPTKTPASPPPVPAEYRELYQELEDELTSFEKVLEQKWDKSRGQTIFATELAFANGNIGEGLLLLGTFENNRVLLDQLKSMGIKAVALSIKFPLLKPDFPRSSEYLKFYKDIANEARRCGMKVLVETGAIFSGTPYSAVQVDWSKYTTESFLQGMQAQLLVVAREIRPDYLTLTEEPTTQEALTKLKIAPAAWNNFVSSTLKKISRSGGMLVGASMGNWEAQAYVDEIMRMPEIDYIDLHIYPLGRNGALFERALNIALEVRKVGKRVTIGESWLYKALPEEMTAGPGIDGNIFNRDVFSFWYPLDMRFIRDVMSLADAAGADFTSFFWLRNFFAYLDYSSELNNLPTSNVNRRMNQAALANVKDGILSPSGEFFKQQLQSRD